MKIDDTSLTSNYTVLTCSSIICYPQEAQYYDHRLLVGLLSCTVYLTCCRDYHCYLKLERVFPIQSNCPQLRNHFLKMSLYTNFLYNETFPVLVVPVFYYLSKCQTVYKEVKFIQSSIFFCKISLFHKF